MKKSVTSSLTEAFEELFEALNMDTVLVESELKITTKEFVKDFLHMCDEVKSAKDIVETWHVDSVLAKTLFSLFSEVVFGGASYDHSDTDFPTDLEYCDSDFLDQSTDSDND